MIISSIGPSSSGFSGKIRGILIIRTGICAQSPDSVAGPLDTLMMPAALSDASCTLPVIREGIYGRLWTTAINAGEKAVLNQGSSWLSTRARHFWLHQAHGLDSFQYSSRQFNPLFHLLGWGPALLGLMASKTQEQHLTRDDLSRVYPVLATDLNPRANAYLLERIVLNSRFSRIGTEIFSWKFEQFSGSIMSWLRKIPWETNAPYTHLLPLDPLFVNLLRLGAGIRKIREDAAKSLQTEVDKALHHFINRMD
jgi:hypothetical protein